MHAPTPDLRSVELELLQLLPNLDLRPTLAAAIRAGELLVTARENIPHGGWLPFLKRLRLTQRTANDYVACYRHRDVGGKAAAAASMSIKRFLRHMRDVKHAERQAEREKCRAEYAAEPGRLIDAVRLVNADCRSYDWPRGEIDGAVIDPPWADLDCYAWAADWAKNYSTLR